MKEGEQLPLLALNESQTDFRVLSLKNRAMITGRVGPSNNLLTLHAESLIKDEDEIVQAEAGFIGVTQELIQAGIQRTASHLSRGSEVISADLEYDDLENSFKGAVARLKDLGFEQKDIIKIIHEQGRLFANVAPSQMGYSPSIVRAYVGVLNRRVEDYLKDMEKSEQRAG